MIKAAQSSASSWVTDSLFVEAVNRIVCIRRQNSHKSKEHGHAEKINYNEDFYKPTI